MHRLVVRTVAVASLAALVAGGTLTAHAKSSRPKSWGGKKALGTVLSFDPATLALAIDMAEGDDFAGTLAADAQVKLDHRGHSKRGDGHGNPSRGSLEDLVAGESVLRLKTKDDLVTKIRLRPAPEPPAAPSDEGDEDDTDDSGDALPDGSSGEDVDDIADEDDADEADSDTPDDDASGDVEDALPPLPVNQP